MQTRRRDVSDAVWRRCICGLVLVLSTTLVSRSGLTRADEIKAGVYVRADSDRTVVVTPSAGARASIVDDRTQVEVGYAADIWTSASIDIRTAASARVTEQRDELTVGVQREFVDVSLGVDYRFSHEPDYVSHGGGINFEQKFAEGNATFRTRLFAAQDTVGRAGDNSFSRRLSTVGLRAVFNQVIDAKTVIQGAYELGRREGFQSSPYRFVGIGGDGLCSGTAVLCVPEAHPGTRLRHVGVIRARRAIGSDFSAGLAYRFYFDDWNVLSHTAIAQASWLPAPDSTVELRYRFYHQSAADFYRARYEAIDTNRPLVSRDRELSPLLTNRLSLSYERVVDLTAAGPPLRLSAATSAMLLSYSDFVGLDKVWAFDVILSGAVEL